MFRVWPSQRIRQAVSEELISAGTAVTEQQIQPASLDLRLGARAHRVPASFLPGKHRTVAERLAQLATHEVGLDQPQVLERNCVHIIEIAEHLRLPSSVSARANPKSSSGRLDIFVRLITDGGSAFDEIPAGYEGPLYAEVVPRSFPVIAAAGTCLNQIRFRDHSLTGPATPVRPLPISVDLDPEGKPGGVIGYRARRTSGLVDLAKIGAHRRADFWEPISLPPGRLELTLDPDDFYILASLESVSVPPDEALEMVAYDTSIGEARMNYAGFLDPGFGLAEAGGEGSKVVLEVRGHDVPFLLDHGQRVGTLVSEALSERPERLYGQSNQANYQGQRLKLSKQFD